MVKSMLESASASEESAKDSSMTLTTDLQETNGALANAEQGREEPDEWSDWPYLVTWSGININSNTSAHLKEITEKR